MKKEFDPVLLGPEINGLKIVRKWTKCGSVLYGVITTTDRFCSFSRLRSKTLVNTMQ